MADWVEKVFGRRTEPKFDDYKYVVTIDQWNGTPGESPEARLELLKWFTNQGLERHKDFDKENWWDDGIPKVAFGFKDPTKALIFKLAYYGVDISNAGPSK